MEFNPAKFEHLQITTLQKVTIIMGATSGHLSWKNHVDTIAAKAIAAQAFLQRNTTFCPMELKIHHYNMFVHPIMEYSDTAWSPHSALGISKLERVQRKAARYVFNHFIVFLPCFIN